MHTSVDVEPLIYRHLAAMKLANRRQTTIYARERNLIRLSAWAQGPILYLTAQQLAQWQRDIAAGLDGEPLSSSSVRVITVHVRQFYAWSLNEGLINEDPTAKLVTPARKPGLPRPMSDDQFGAALERADPEMAAILGLARFAGLRACEIAQLDWTDLALAARTPTLTVREGKGGYARQVHLARRLVDLLRDLPHRTGPVIRRQDGIRRVQHGTADLSASSPVPA